MCLPYLFIFSLSLKQDKYQKYVFRFIPLKMALESSFWKSYK